MTNSLLLTQKSQQKISPKSIQGLQVLSLPITELTDFLENAVLENPLIEQDDQHDEYENASPEIISTDFSGLGKKQKRAVLDASAKEEAILGNVPENETLHGFLRLQLSLCNFTKIKRAIGEEIIGNINDDGYFVGELQEIAYNCQQEFSACLEVLKKIQTFYPTGVGARSIEECLILQIDPNIPDYHTVIQLIHYDLEDLAEHRMTKLSKKYKLTKDKIQEVLDYIRTLNPRPGNKFYQKTTTNYIIPDVVVKKDTSHFNIYVNNKSEHGIRINENYLQMLNNQEIGRNEKDYIHDRYQEAKTLMKCLEMRNETLTHLAAFIFRAQHSFFEYGTNHLKPMMMQEAAEALGVHVSTISRAVQGKYIQTIWGIFPFKYFFTSPSTKQPGEDIPATCIKTKIQKIINSENSQSPLSDLEIMEKLKEENICISRRTVAKYRQSMGIEGQSKRRRFV